MPKWLTVFFCLQIAIPPALSAEADGDEQPGMARRAALITASINRNPRDPLLYVKRAKFYYGAFKTKEALEDCSAALKIEPHCARAINLKAEIYGTLGRYSEAVSEYSKAIKIDPSNCYALADRSSAYVALGKEDCALSDLNKAEALSPKNATIHRQRALLCEKMHLYSAAIAEYTTLLNLRAKADYRSYYARRADLYRKIDQPRPALSDYSKAIAEDPDDSDYYRCRGDTLYLMGEFRKAIAEYSSAIKLDPDQSLLYSARAKALEKCGDVGGANEDRKRALK